MDKKEVVDYLNGRLRKKSNHIDGTDVSMLIRYWYWKKDYVESNSLIYVGRTIRNAPASNRISQAFKLLNSNKGSILLDLLINSLMYDFKILPSLRHVNANGSGKIRAYYYQP